MKQSNSSNHKTFTLIGIIVAIVIIGGFLFISRTQDETVPQDSDITILTIEPTPEPTPQIKTSPVSPLSPIPVVSPIQKDEPFVQPLDPDTVERKIKEGLAFYEAGNYESAIEIFDDLLARNANDIVSYNSRGSAYLALGNIDQALSDFSRAIEIDSEFPYPYYNRGRVYASLEEHEDAVSDLRKSIDLFPKEFGYRANGNIGLIYHQTGDYDKALEAFEESISFNNDENADVYYFRGETYTALEEYEAAIADYQSAIDRFADYVLAYRGLGYAYLKTNQLDNAFEALNQAAIISSDNPQPHFLIALVHLAENDLDKAEEEISQAISLSSDLSPEDKNNTYQKAVNDLEAFAVEQPDKADEAKMLIDLILDNAQ